MPVCFGQKAKFASFARRLNRWYVRVISETPCASAAWPRCSPTSLSPGTAGTFLEPPEETLSACTFTQSLFVARRSCASRSAVASYQVRNGTQGLLYPTDCEAGPDAARDNIGLYRFENITGAERCVGSMPAIPNSKI